MAVKALYPISLPRSEQAAGHVIRQSIDANETRLNENFKRLSERLLELEDRIARLEATMAGGGES